tara:strand:+ start:503 stop:877 length:375 start_codon:yes stop_codon:yes gene_type:complete
VKQTRPVNLDLMALKFPVTAILSILHRVSGILIFLLFPGMLYLLSLSLGDGAGYTQAMTLMTHPMGKLLLWAFLSALTYHLLAGTRHIVMDLGFGEGLPTGRYTAYFVLIVTAIAVISLGVFVW